MQKILYIVSFFSSRGFCSLQKLLMDDRRLVDVWQWVQWVAPKLLVAATDTRFTERPSAVLEIIEHA